MKWFKHEASANMDAKLQEVLLDYGLEGYGLYWYCLELIAGNVEADKLTFELEHDCRIIARNTGSTAQKVQEMMTSFIKVGLFEESQGRITCLKLAKVSDDYTAKLVRSKPPQVIDFKENLESPTNSEKDPLDKNKTEENREEENREYNNTVSTVPEKKKRVSKSDTWRRFYEEYPEQRRGGSDATPWKKAKQKRLTEFDFVDMLEDVINRKANCDQWNKGFVQGITKYIEDEIWKTPVRSSQIGTTNDFSTANASLERLMDTDW